MHTIDHIVIITTKYPVGRRIIGHTFVRKLAEGLADRAPRVTVIAPEPFLSVSEKRVQLRHEDHTVNGVRVLVPPYLSAGSRLLPGGYNTIELTTELFTRSVLSMARLVKGGGRTLVYGHFFYPAGYAATRLAKKLGAKSVVGLGGNVHGTEEVMPMPPRRRARDIQRFDGWLAVSKEVERLYASKYGLSGDRLVVFPNAADTRDFNPRDKAEMRRKLGLPADTFLVAFVGRFEKLKGSRVLEAALDKAGGMKAVFLGQGGDEPTSEHVIHAGTVKHDQVPEYLSAADVFCLPTLVEGSSNAIKEAMACGLPVVSANRPFNTDDLDDSVGLFVDPESVDAVAEALVRFRDDPAFLAEKRAGALAYTERYNLGTRADGILEWFERLYE